MAGEKAIPVGRVGLGPGFRHTRTIDVSSDDFEPGYEFALHVGAPGTAGSSSTIKYRTVYGSADQSITVTEAYEVKFMGQPIRLKAVRAAASGAGNTALATGVTLSVGIF